MALPRERLLTAEEAATRGADRANEGHLVPLIAAGLIDHVDAAEWRGLAVRGLQAAIHDERSRRRIYAESLPHAADGVEPPNANEGQVGPIRHLLPKQTHPARDFWMLALSETYRVGDAMKSVLDLNAAEAAHLADSYRARAYGNHKRADAFALTAKLLKEHKVDTVRGLSTAAQQSIAGALR